MAEIAPLTSARNHARKAADEYQHTHLAQAAQEHQLASTDFSRAAKGTSDAEALRVLKLLEEQHRKLASIVGSQEKPLSESTSEKEKSVEPPLAAKDASSTSSPPSKAGMSRSKHALANTRLGSHMRDSSPSLARDIASRRGIPPPSRTQPSAAAQARSRALSPESKRRAPPGGAPKVPASIIDSQVNLQKVVSTRRAEDDEGFSKFYSNLSSGTMSKLSSVLAYAGLPLTADDANMDSNSAPKPDKPTVSAGNEPDVKKIFSKAALDAIEDEHRRRGTLGHGFGPAESFLVVPKSGGTSSYADIAKAQKYQLSGIGEDDEAEFVDAKEVPGPPSPQHSRFTNPRRVSFGSPRTQEELELENDTLKLTLEQLAGRLAAFEAHAQDASMAALTQSMANLRSAPDEKSNGGQGKGTNEAQNEAPVDAAMQERLEELERQLQREAEQRQKLETHAIKQGQMLKTYKARWDDLKKNAKERRDKAGKTTDEVAEDGVTRE